MSFEATSRFLKVRFSMRYSFPLLVLSLVVILNGCAFVDVNLLSSHKPLQEQVVEGDGPKKILIVDIEGFISEKGASGLLQEKPSTVVMVKEALQKAAGDRDIAGVILRINSPGGTVAASDIIYHEVATYRSKTKIPVYAVITGIGASGGYYVAAAADEISAHPAAVTGSIGVLVMKFQVTGLMEKIGVSEQTVKSGAMKDIMSPFRPGTPEEEKLIQGIIDGMYRRFVDVALARPGNRLSREELIVAADGRIYTADQALKAGLIDRIAYLDETIAALKQKLGLDRASIIVYYRPGGYRGTIYSGPPEGSPPVINLLNIDAGNLDLLTSSRFLYLWK
jgi:protease-4